VEAGLKTVEEGGSVPRGAARGGVAEANAARQAWGVLGRSQAATRIGRCRIPPPSRCRGAGEQVVGDVGPGGRTAIASPDSGEPTLPYCVTEKSPTSAATALASTSAISWQSTTSGSPNFAGVVSARRNVSRAFSGPVDTDAQLATRTTSGCRDG
jgi:hypothetical protein